MNERGTHPSVPDQVFRVATGWRVRIFIVMTFLSLILLLAVGSLPLLPHIKVLDVLKSVFFAGISSFFLYTCLSAFTSIIEIYPDRIRRICWFGVNELRHDEIMGFTLNVSKDFNKIHIIPSTPKKRAIRFTLMYERGDELLAWAKQNLTQLDPSTPDGKVRHINLNSLILILIPVGIMAVFIGMSYLLSDSFD